MFIRKTKVVNTEHSSWTKSSSRGNLSPLSLFLLTTLTSAAVLLRQLHALPLLLPLVGQLALSL